MTFRALKKAMPKTLGLPGLMMVSAAFIAGPVAATTLKEQNDALFLQLQKVHGLSDAELKKVKDIFTRSGFVGQGNPAITKHSMTPQQCQDKLAAAKVSYENADFEKICGDKYMAPLYNPKTESAKDAKACIDQFEFPNIPCAYPVVWVRASEAAQICEAMGKRLCDAHEWEGACAGALEEPDYFFDLAKGQTMSNAVKRMRAAHNKKYAGHKVWAYGAQPQKGICAMGSSKSPDCDGGNWKKCGSNTYPVGAFPKCVSKLMVYDQHGNAAEHMNLPLKKDEMSSKGSTKLGVTEMKGSWFIFDSYRAHADACRWRAPFWHGSRVMDDHSHHNYHLGFRCCKTIK